MSEPQVEHILEVGLGFWASKTLLSAVELGVFTKLAEGPADLQTLTEALGIHSRSARDFFDALVALGFLERSGGTYRNTSSTDFFLDRQKPSYVGGILEMANLRLYPCWGSLTMAQRTGQHQSESKGEQDAFAKALCGPPAAHRVSEGDDRNQQGSQPRDRREFPLEGLQEWPSIWALRRAIW